MKCLYCGKRILAFQLFSGGETFCSEEHGNLYRKDEAANAIQRILTLDAPKKPLRLTPAPVVAAIPAISEPEPPPMAGFRLPVLEASNYAGGAQFGPLPISLEILTPAYCAQPPACQALSYFNLAWTGDTHRVDSNVTPLPAPHRQRTPIAPLPGFAPSARGPLQEIPWEPRPYSLLRLGEALAVQTTDRLCPVTVAEPPASALAFAVARLGWPALADGQAQTYSAADGLEAAPSIAMPYLLEERFTSTWHAHRMLTLWKGCPEASSGTPAFAEVSSILPSLLRLPAPSTYRDARPGAASLASLWRIASDDTHPVAAIASSASHAQPSLGEIGSSPRALALARFQTWPLASCRPFPAMPRVAPEPAMELSLWNAWPELPRIRLAPGQLATALGNGQTWRPQTGKAAVRSAAGLRILDVPERCRTLALTLAAESSTLRPASLGRTRDWPLAAAAPVAHPRPLATVISPRESIHPPAQARPEIHQPLAVAPVRSVAPRAVAPPLEGQPRPELGRTELTLRLATQWPQAGASAPRPLAVVPLRPAGGLAPQAPAPERAATPGLPTAPEGTVRYPAATAAVAVRLADARGAKHVWGQASQGRPLDATLAQPRETPLRLSVEEIPCSCTLDVRPPEAQPAASSWTSLALLPAAASREFVTPTLVPIVDALRTPGLLVNSRAASVSQAYFAAPAWTGRQAAPEAVVRRRQLPASRPKMKLPRPLPLKGSIALPGLTQLAAILATERTAIGHNTVELVER